MGQPKATREEHYGQIVFSLLLVIVFDEPLRLHRGLEDVMSSGWVWVFYRILYSMTTCSMLYYVMLCYSLVYLVRETLKSLNPKPRQEMAAADCHLLQGTTDFIVWVSGLGVQMVP